MSATNIHTPTINGTGAGSGSSSNSNSNSNNLMSEELQRLLKQRTSIENELDELVSVLQRVSSIMVFSYVYLLPVEMLTTNA